MGDLSTEPSMEEILSSIKRIIAEEGDTPPGRNRRPARGPTPSARDEDGVLELSDPMPLDRPAEAHPVADQPRTVEPPRAADPEPLPAVEPAMPIPPMQRSAEPIVSPQAAQAARGALDQLSRVAVKPEPSTGASLEAVVTEMLRPMLRDWIDAHLPHMVEDLVAKEIARITNAPR